MKKICLALPAVLACALILAQPMHGREVIDMTGRVVRVPETVSRIVSPYRVATGILLILGEQDRLVGISTTASPMAQRIFPRLSEADTANRHSSIEEILKMKPDLVFTSPGQQVNDLETAGIPVFCIVVEDPDSLIAGIGLVADLLGRRKRAEEISSYYRSKIDFIKRRTSGVKQKKTVYLAGAHMLSAVGGDFYQDRVIGLAGGINVSRAGRGGWISVSREHLLSWNPDVILTLPYHSASLPGEILTDRGLSTVKAVSGKSVYTFPSYIDSWDLPSPESILGIMWLAGILYPEEIDFDMEKEAREFYIRLYGSYPEPISLERRHAP
jgi:iron complex transport system substrate-binding protein